MSWTRLRWVAVILPVIAIGFLDLLTDHEWDDLVDRPLNTLTVPLIVLIGAIAFARLTFRRIDRLADEVHDARAIHGERARIAREMHDGLAQVLGYVNTKAQAVEELLAQGQTDAARRQLTELAAAARAVHADIREAILGLTSPVAAERGLVGALEDYARRFSQASTLATSVDATPSAQALRLRPELQAEVFRIAQEGLTNVRKHAAAHHVRVRLDADDRALVLAIEDDGVGLSAGMPSTTGWPHFGMQAMRERAASINATTEWRAGAGAGTVFRLTVPLARAMTT